MTVIELGEATWTDHPSPGSSPRERRLLASALLTALCLAGLGASARPAPMGVEPLWSAPGAAENGTLLTRDTAYLQERTPDGTRLIAYELATGAQRWSRDMTGSIGYLYPTDEDGPLLAPTDRQVVVLQPGSPDPVAPEFHRETVALDPRTGTQRWHAAGEPMAVDRDTAMMAEYDGEGTPRRQRVVRLSDGRTLWSLDTPGIDAQTIVRIGDRPTALITVAKDGTVTTHRFSDGRRTGRVQIRWSTGKRENGYYNDIFVAGDNLVVNHAGPNGLDVRVFRADTMVEQWHIRSDSGYLIDCGGLLCLNISGNLAAYDYSGVKRWERPNPSSVMPASAGRLVLDNMGGDDDHPTLIDTATGKMIGDPPTGYVVWSTEPTDSLLLLRAASSPANRTAIIRWDLRTGRHHVIGMIDRSAGVDCQSVPKFLVCRRGADMVEVTAVR